MRKRWRTRAFGLAALIPLTIASLLLLAPSSALANPLPYAMAYQAPSGTLWTADNVWSWYAHNGSSTAWDFGMAPGTSPSITALTDGGWEVAAQANTGELWTIGTDDVTDWHSVVRAGTSPAIPLWPRRGRGGGERYTEVRRAQGYACPALTRTCAGPAQARCYGAALLHSAEYAR